MSKAALGHKMVETSPIQCCMQKREVGGGAAVSPARFK